MENQFPSQKQALFVDLIQTSIQLRQSTDLLAWTKAALDAGTPLWEERFVSKLSGGNELAPEMEMLIQETRQTTEETSPSEIGWTTSSVQKRNDGISIASHKGPTIRELPTGSGCCP